MVTINAEKDRKVVALTIEGLVPSLAGFQIVGIYKECMDPSIMKAMNFFLRRGLDMHDNGSRTSPDFKGQITRYGLGYVLVICPIV